MRWVLLVSLVGAVTCVPNEVPYVELKNAPGVKMPAIGLGFGWYRDNETRLWAQPAAENWLEAGGRWVDTALQYKTHAALGRAIAKVGTPRDELFIVTKVPPVGNDTRKAFEECMHELTYKTGFQTDYVDMLLMHYPYPIVPTPYMADPSCNPHVPSGRECRQNGWAIMADLVKEGKVKAIGTSNFQAKHIQDLLDMKNMPIPALNQNEYHVYWHEDKYGWPATPCENGEGGNPPPGQPPRDLLGFLDAHDIQYNAFAPLGTPDVAPIVDDWNSTQLVLPVVVAMGEKYGKTGAQVLLRWHWQNGVVANPRSHNRAHMEENLNIFDFQLTDEEMLTLSTRLPIPDGPCPNSFGGCCSRINPDPLQWN